MNESNLIKQIKSAQVSKNISNAELGRMVNMDRQNIWRFFNNEGSPQLCTVYRIAKACGIESINVKIEI
jgi:DNA-binding phage protein